MRNLFAFVGAAVIAFVGLGWYLGWYQVKSSTPSLTGHQNVNIDINSVKIMEDVNKGVKTGEDKLHQVLEKRQQAAFASTAPTPTAPEVSPTVPLMQPRPSDLSQQAQPLPSWSMEDRSSAWVPAPVGQNPSGSAPPWNLPSANP